jgi:hypothetical protein
MRLFSRPLLIAPVALALALGLSACTAFKSESFSVSQPGGLGSVHLHLIICTETSASGAEECAAEDRTGSAQSILAFAVPVGSQVPTTFTATPNGPGPTISYSRNQEVAERITEQKTAEEAETKKEEEEGKTTDPSWRVPGTEVIGYLSAPYAETEGQKLEWPVDVTVGLPAPADGGAFAGRFITGVASGWRLVDAGHPADRAVSCFEGSMSEFNGGCFLQESLEAPVSDLRVSAPPAASVYVGGTAAVPFTLNFGSSLPAPPTFGFAVSASLPGAKVAVSPATFAPTLDASTHRAAPQPVSATVAVPKGTAPGTYDVTLTATSNSGGSVSQVAKLIVTKPVLKLGKLILNKKNGTAKLSVSAPSAGKLTLAGKKIVVAKRSLKGPGIVKLSIRAKGKAKSALKEKGKATVRALVTFTPSGASPVSKSRSVALKRTG